MAKWKYIDVIDHPTTPVASSFDSGNTDYLYYSPTPNNLDVYQQECLKLAIFPKDKALVYLGLKLAGEAGEVAEKIGKNIRDGGQLDDIGLAKELGDVMWYVAVLAEHLGYDLSEIADMNIKKLKDRKERNVIKGSGDSR